MFNLVYFWYPEIDASLNLVSHNTKMACTGWEIMWVYPLNLFQFPLSLSLALLANQPVVIWSINIFAPNILLYLLIGPII